MSTHELSPTLDSGLRLHQPSLSVSRRIFIMIDPRRTVGCLLRVPTKISLHPMAMILGECVLLQRPAFFSDLVTQAEGWF